jgi:hypothetical protein
MALGVHAFAQTTITVNLAADRKPISPLIYGVNFATPDQANKLNLRLNRSGGNATTRYNWQRNATSSGSDWYFLSHTEGAEVPSGSVDSWVQGNLSTTVPGGTASMVTIPTIGWVAKIHPNRGSMWSYSVAKYGAQQQTEPWNPDAGNGVRTNGTLITTNDPNDANIPVAITFQQGWLEHLVGRFGNAQSGGVGYYLLDNEPGLWHETHRDVHPTGATMQQLFDRSRDAALVIKQIDPTAKVCGPEEWGWLSYIYSGFDFQWLAAHGWQGNPPDRAAHGNMDQAPWLLQQFAAASANAGKRLLDVFTLHYYPQGNYGWNDTSANAQLWRNRSTRSLWDPNYTDESWIGQKINLIPRMKAWVAQYYPGTQTGITEYNWGVDDHISGAIVQADALGIFGREGVDLANRWVCPPTDSRVFKAFQMYRNYDGFNATFGDVSVRTTGGSPDILATFGSQETSTGRVKVMLINKDLDNSALVQVVLQNAPRLRRTRAFQLRSTGNIQPVLPTHKKRPLQFLLPPQSITIVEAHF